MIGNEISIEYYDKLFLSQDDIFEQITKVTVGEDSPIKPMDYACKVCDEQFVDSDKLQTHIRMVHQTCVVFKHPHNNFKSCFSRDYS